MSFAVVNRQPKHRQRIRRSFELAGFRGAIRGGEMELEHQFRIGWITYQRVLSCAFERSIEFHVRPVRIAAEGRRKQAAVRAAVGDKQLCRGAKRRRYGGRRFLLRETGRRSKNGAPY